MSHTSDVFPVAPPLEAGLKSRIDQTAAYYNRNGIVLVVYVVKTAVIIIQIYYNICGMRMGHDNGRRPRYAM